VNLMQVYPFLANQIIISHKVSVPNLHSKHVRVHILGLLRVVYGEFHSIVEVSNRSACPMCVCLLRFACANSSTDIDIVWLHFYIFKDAIISLPDNDSKLILVEWWWSYWMGRWVKPFSLLY
jgi:hypothetical protein